MVVISGPSGVGKGTVIAEVRKRRPGLGLSVSWTTRRQRPAEKDGREYRFVTSGEFQRAIDADEILEWEEYRGAWYGTPWSEVREPLAAGRDIVLELDVRGARSVKDRFPDAVTIFIRPPAWEDLERRLVARGTDSPEQIRLRLAEARRELEAVDGFDHVVVNDQVARCADEVASILDAAG